MVSLSPPRTLPLFDPADLPPAAPLRPAAGLAAEPAERPGGRPDGRSGGRPDVPPHPAGPACWPAEAPPVAAASPVAQAMPAAERPLQAPPALHPALWRASQVGGAPGRRTPTGFDALDAQLPGGGWPHGVLTELLLAQPGIGELRLLAPALATLSPPDEPVPSATATATAARGPAATTTTRSPAELAAPPPRRGRSPSGPSGQPVDAPAHRCVMLFDPPAVPSAWALLQQGLGCRHWLVVRPRPGSAGAAGAGHGAPRGPHRLAPLLPAADLLWALEQALRSGHVGAVLAWVPRGLRADALRRLQLAAQAHDGPVFVFRDAQAAPQPSAAPLRLLLQPAGVDGLALRLLKRRGPPLAQVLRLALPPVLTPGQQAQALTRQLARGRGPAVALG